MKVLWSVNVIIEEAGKEMGFRSVAQVSWLNHMSHEIRKRAKLIICFPTEYITELTEKEGNNIKFYAIPRKSRNGFKYEAGLSEYYKEIIKSEEPDIIHIWGTEYPNIWNITQVCQEMKLLDRTVVSVQGLISLIARHFYASLPFHIQHKYALKNFIKGNNLFWYRRKFIKRGKYEVLALQHLRHVIGRTDWDRAGLYSINNKLQYHYNCETLRKAFYSAVWKYDKCVAHRIFMSQGGLPYKGVHYTMEALAEIVKIYPDTHLYMTGRNLLPKRPIKEQIRISSYEKYIQELIKKYHLEEHITFLGTLNETDMCEQYSKANVFILPSAIENSPNSLGEAMLVGTPVVAADVGGVRNLMTDKKEGYIYQHDAPYMLAYYILKIFEKSKEELTEMSESERAHAKELYNPEKNAEDLMNIYQSLLSE